MGGGGVMRAAAKVAGVGIVNSGLRGAVQVNPSPAEHSVMRVAASRSASSGISVSGGAVSPVSDVKSSANHNLSWEMVDDWELVCGFEEEVAMGGSISVSRGGEPMARVLFGGGVPSLEEAKEATADLKDALDKVYPSPPPKSVEAAEASGLSLLSNSEEITKDCVAFDVKATIVPKSAIQAFKLLNDSPAVQSVVASIATDPNVWNAVLKNPAYMEFIQSQKTYHDQFEDEGSPQSFESSVKIEEYSDATQPKVDRRNFIQNVKATVVELVNKATDFLQSLFSTSPSAGNNAEENGGSNYFDKSIGASVMGLAVMVIMVVLLKRA